MNEYWEHEVPLIGIYTVVAEKDTSYPPYRFRAYVSKAYDWDESYHARKTDLLEKSNEVHQHILSFGYRPYRSLRKNPEINFIWFQTQEDTEAWLDLVPRAAMLMRLTN